MFPIWGAAEFLIFVIGIMLILYGLKVIVVHRTKGDVLVTTGPYRWIRHPQHLGIIMSLLAPALSFSYIRPSDIVSWSLIAFGLIVSADLEEVSLSKRFGEKFDEYRSKVSFMIPYCLPFPTVMKSGVLGQGRPARYVLWFVIYWLIMTFILFLFSFVRIDHWL